MADDSRSTPDAEQDQVILGQALRELRDRAGITQGELAARMGIDLTYISRVERGKRGVRWHTVLRFLAALDSDLHELADAVDTATKP
jgi:transcriptional regulator with XRE-family HTH domain